MMNTGATTGQREAGEAGGTGKKQATPIKVAIAPICVGGAANCLIKDHATPACHTNRKESKR